MDDETFWDEFAAEYEAIQQESNAAIEPALTEFLLTEKILPAKTLVDLAGGTGRYVPFLQPYVTRYLLVDFSQAMLEIARTKSRQPNLSLNKQTQQTFLATTPPHSIDVIFSAMNPALTPPDLLQLKHLAQSYVLILRLVEQKDRLFSPFETNNPALRLNEAYKKFLLQQQIPFKTKTFRFQTTEIITKDFFTAYFADELAPEKLTQVTQTFFADQPTAENPQVITFELLYFPA